MAKTKTGIQPSIWSKEMSPNQLGRAPLEEDDEQAVGGADREQVEDDRLEREQQRPERAQKQDVGQEQHAEDEPREGAVGEVEEVDAARRAAAREDVDVVREAGGRDDLVAQPVDEVERGRNAVLAPAGRPRCGGSCPVGSTHCGLAGSNDTRATSGSASSPSSSRASAAWTSSSSTPPGRAVSMTTAVGASAPSPTSSETMFSPRIALEVLRDALVRARADLEREDRQRQRARGRRSSPARRSRAAS